MTYHVGSGPPWHMGRYTGDPQARGLRHPDRPASGTMSSMLASDPWEDIGSWERWVEELEDHPLDAVEFESMLIARDGIDDGLELLNDERAFETVDDLDERFERITVVGSHGQFRTDRPGWWWRRVPSDPEAFQRLLGNY